MGGIILGLFIFSIFTIALDQASKYLAVEYLKDGTVYSIIDKFLELSYVENYGAGFGILQNKKTFLIIVTGLVILALAFVFYRNYNRMNLVMKLSLLSLIGGSMGNLIDRVRLGYVVDFISVRFGNGYDFPVFNVADMFVVIGTVLLIFIILFDKDFQL